MSIVVEAGLNRALVLTPLPLPVASASFQKPHVRQRRAEKSGDTALPEGARVRKNRPWTSGVLGLYSGFPDSSVGKESACNAGDPGSIPGSGRSAGEGIGYPLQYSWASLVAQLVKNPPAKWEAWVPSLGWKDLLEKEKAPHSSILAWRFPWTV